MKRQLVQGWTRRRETSRALLYTPDATDLDLRRHLDEALNWLKRAQDAGSDAGVAYGVSFGADFDVSYPETTGYICRTFVEQARLTGDDALLDRAISMADWEIDIQLPEGAVMGGKVNTRPTPAVFNTGMVLLGWSALAQHVHEERFKQAATRASDWLVSIQEADGRWARGNSRFAAPEATVYNVMAAWGLCEAGAVLGDERYIDAALRNGEYCLSRQHANGWLPDCCLSDPRSPLLHTLAYSMQGLIGIGKLTCREDLIAGARLLADSILGTMQPNGFVPGRLNDDFSAGADWSCLTGSAQTSIIWNELHLLTGADVYRTAAITIDDYLMARHDIRNADPRLRGGLPGSWPTWGDYGSVRILNWATKFLVDALSLEQRVSGR